MKKILAPTLFLLFALMSARADVIWNEGFQYDNGSIIYTSTNAAGGTNWIRYSGTAIPPDMFVNNHHLEVSSTGAGSAVNANRQDDCGRLFATTSGSPYTNGPQLIYISFIATFTNLPTAGITYFCNLKYGAPGSTSYEGKIFSTVGVLPNTLHVGVSASANSPSATYTTDLALNTPYQFVMEWDPVDLLAYSIWVNPVSYSDVKAVSNDALTAANIANMIAFRQASGSGVFLTVSNLVVATTFSEALTNTLPTNAVAPQIVYQPVGFTNYVGASASLSAVANGQGLGGLVYQWQKGGSPVGGNMNVLSFPSAQQSDSGDYTLVVTTPYGLSVTSSVATVLISVAPVPPTFTEQPASNTPAYNDQTVVLHAEATGPPTISYQWYLDDNILSDSAIFEGTSSDTLTIYDVSTANGNTGTYKVVATNPYGDTPSSNAVVSATTPQAVTIAYLRTLVDPVTYAPTNVPATIAYQVTGIVTTYTNSTTGNTASYFLQDATGGINIFATFGSTFRPAQGDSVTYVGVLSSYSTTGLELYADTQNLTFTSYMINSSGNPLPTPVVIPFDVTNDLDNVNYNLAGKLVTLNGVYFGTNSGTLTPTNVNFTVTVTNASGKSFILQFFAPDQDTWSQTLPTYASSVTGILYGFSPNFSVGITKFSDIVAATPPAGPTSIAISTVSNNGGNVTLNWTPVPAGSYSYTVWRTTSLNGTPTWTTLQTGITGTSYTDVGVSAATGFYRVSSP